MTDQDLPPTYRLFRAVWIVLFVLVTSALVVGIALLVSGLSSGRLG